MSLDFQLQKLSTDGRIWYTPEDDEIVVRARDISTLKDQVQKFADRTPFDWWQGFRIVTYNGSPVWRAKVRPGVVKETRSRY